MKKRDKGKRRARKIVKTVLPALAVLLVGVLGTLGFVGYRLTHPPASSEAVLPAHYLLAGTEVSWGARDGLEIPGLWIPGRVGAAAVVLAPGHGMSRSDALSLASELHRMGFHILVYAERGSGSAPRGAAWLGTREPEDMAAALDFAKGRPDVDRRRLGIWGVDVGAYSALRAAATRPEVVAIAADSPFAGVRDFVRVRLREDLGLRPGGIEDFLAGVLSTALGLVGGGGSTPLDLAAFAGRDVLLIRGANRPWAEEFGSGLAAGLGPAAKVAVLPAARVRLLSGENLVQYDRRVAAFFQSTLGGRKDSRRQAR